ncbi:MAG: hypothetical protein ACPGN3_18000 [Opitutales bacterium]
MKNVKGILCILSIASGTGLFGQSTLASWDLSGVDVADLPGGSPYALDAGSLGTDIDSAFLSLSSSVNPSTSAGQYGFKVSGVDETTDLAGAIAAGHYIEFSITPEAGYSIDFTSIDFLGESTGTGADGVAFFSSIEGFGVDDVIDSVAGIQDVTGGFDTDSSGFGDLIIPILKIKEP